MRNVLFLCTGNSARSILAEVLLNELGQGAWRAFSAGSHPTGRVNPGALEKLAAEGHRTAELESKSWDVFSEPDAPGFDLVITVCDSAAGETCPIWNGAPVRAHWGIPDPAGIDDDAARRAAFDIAYARLRRRVEDLAALPEDLDGARLSAAVGRIHADAGAADSAGA